MQNVFKCQNCNYIVKTKGNIGTKNRNHCPKCLYSKHVDSEKAGDRASTCQEVMRPIGLTFKSTGVDKYGKTKQGEIMIVHRCKKCQKISINRVAGDDDEVTIIEIHNQANLDESPLPNNIKLLTEEDTSEVRKQLFGE